MNLIERINELDLRHRNNCVAYRAIVEHMFGTGPFNTIETLPFIHVSVFKEHELTSIDSTKAHRIMTSSGTSGRPSKIFIDKSDSLEQVKSLSAIWTARFGSHRRQMFIVNDRTNGTHDARWAAMAGFTMFGKSVTTLTDTTNTSDIRDEEPILVGMTTDIWAHRQLLKKFVNCRPVILHGGGWKKLAAATVSREDFLSGLHEFCPTITVVNWFGMIEQVGTVYFDCVMGNFHASDNDTFVIRAIDTLQPTQTGLLQMLSTVPRSYPGHSLLTDDICELVTQCRCGTPTRAFRFYDRRQGTSVRGCANV
jgi:hypothetical protein